MNQQAADIIINLFGLVVVLGQILLVLLIFLYILVKLNKKNKALQKLWNFLSENSLAFSFLISASAVVGSMFLSQIAKIPPCDLCWYQRIFMFPLPIISGIAVFKDDYGIKKYVIPLASIGLVIAIYHYLLQKLPSLPLPCTNSIISCTDKQLELFGYLTIPLMSATAFALVLFLMLAMRKK